MKELTSEELVTLANTYKESDEALCAILFTLSASRDAQDEITLAGVITDYLLNLEARCMTLTTAPQGGLLQ